MNEEELFYRIALTQTNLIGDVIARRLINHFGSATDIFKANIRQIARIENFGKKRIEALKGSIDERKILDEINFIQKKGIQPLFVTDQNYPAHLKQCNDAPVLLYYKGTHDLNSRKTVAIIGTRKNTDYGHQVTSELIEGLMPVQPLIISGLAYGIDIIAHRKALACDIPTVGVLAHGLDRIYPSTHRGTAKEMLLNGGLLTEYPSDTVPDKQNFPMRNRIVAGLADVTVVVETDIKGGAMITAKLAAHYNREVATFPGRTIDTKSKGCNYLIQSNLAHLITGAEDLMEIMNWKPSKKTTSLQTRLFDHLSQEEMQITALLKESPDRHIDELLNVTNLSTTQLSSLLLSLELQNIIIALPGKKFRLSS